MNLKGQKISVNNINLNVFIEGKGRPVILLHGFPDSARVWRNQITFLTGHGFQVIVPDLRGFGDSDAPPGKENYTLENIIGDVTALMDLLGINQVPVVGHDWGAVIGWILAIRHPERVERYVAISVGHPRAYRSDFIQKLRSWYAVLFQIPFLSELGISAIDWFLLRKLTGNHAETNNWISDLSRNGRLTAGLNWYRANFSRILSEDFPNVKVPVFGIWSSGDIFLSRGQMLKSAAYVDGPWRYDMIDGASHWIPLDVPERLNHLLLEYLESVPSSSNIS
ncbi:alpha/beta hydrolase fold [hydrocarbon metagenome]|uniref:Alpha/beta hydrolase fold n=1 Tax=hydrocarbon metagenome TaxID=938273 RepID=A0A0W8FV32_9ZZZZ